MSSSTGGFFKIPPTLPTVATPLPGTVSMAEIGMPKRYYLDRPDLLRDVTIRLRTCRDVHSQRRLLAARIAATGQFTAAQIAEQIGISRRRLFDWMNALKTHGLEGLLQRQHGGGRPRRLSSVQITELKELLLRGATAHGWENNLWTTVRVREVIKRHFGVEFSRSYVWHILTEYLNWSPIRPVQQAAQRDDVEIARWKAEEFPRIERQAEQRGAYLSFVDESGFMMTPVIRRTFAPRGSKPVNKVSDPHGRISVIGAIVINPKRTQIVFRHNTLPDNVNFRSSSVIEFLKELGSHACGPISIIWDQVPTHLSAAVLDYLETAPDIVTEFFPPYAPELNPVDRVWRYLKHDRLPNYTPPTTTQLRATVEIEIKRLQDQSDLLRSFIHQSEVPIAL
jgi:transposase